MKTIIFDEKSTAYRKGSPTNLWFLDMQTDYLKDKCFCRGYLYLNEVYETFGITWDPDEENVCYRENEGGINFKVKPRGNDTYSIHII